MPAKYANNTKTGPNLTGEVRGLSRRWFLQQILIPISRVSSFIMRIGQSGPFRIPDAPEAFKREGRLSSTTPGGACCGRREVASGPAERGYARFLRAA